MLSSTENPKRPGFGTIGKRITLNANIFAVQLKEDITAFQYHVKMIQYDRKKSTDGELIETSKEVDLPVAVSRPLWKFVESEVRKHFSNLQSVYLAYDGKKTCYSTADLCAMGEKVEVEVLFDRTAEDHSKMIHH